MEQKMEQSVITKQPISSSQQTEKLPFAAPDECETVNFEKNEIPENSTKQFTEVIGFEPDAGQYELNEEEKARRRQRQEEATSDCCCVYVPDSDPFFVYMCCHWIMDCFRYIGECTDNCFEDCASCLGNCCEDSGNGDGGCLNCCCSCDDGGDCCGDCLTACMECCVACSCDCSS